MKGNLYRTCITVFIAVACLQVVSSSSAASVAASIPSQVLGITTGVYHPPTVNYGVELNTLNSITGTKHGIAMYYVDWSTAFDPYLQNVINSQMAAADRPVIMIAWGPANGRSSLGCDQNYLGAVPWSRIFQGSCDTYIQNYAQGFKARSERFLLKFAHEMNGGGTLWSPINEGVSPSGFVAAWQHVHDIFAAQGVTNVEWVWSPIYLSYPTTAANDIHLYYPGDNYVDWVGPSGYNYFNQMPGAPQPWNPFTTIFDAVLKDFACRYPKPQIIHEFASVEDYSGANSKAAWISDAYLQAQNYPFLRGLVWYNDRDLGNPNADFRITSSTANYGSVQALPLGSGVWTNAYKNSVAGSPYTHNLPALSAATPPGTYCGVGSTSLTVQPSTVLVQPGWSVNLQFQGWMYSSALNLSLTLPSGISGSVTPNALAAPWGKANINLNISPSIGLGTYGATLHTGIADVPFQIQVVSQVYYSELPLIRR